MKYNNMKNGILEVPLGAIKEIKKFIDKYYYRFDLKFPESILICYSIL
jgi:hypothetical protein